MNQSILLACDKHGVATLTLNRPKHMNCFDEAMSTELLAATEKLLFTPSLKLVVIKGAGKVFMAGGDIHFFNDKMGTFPDGLLPIIRRLGASITNLQKLSVPVLGAVHGAIAGAGLSLMLACDLVIAAQGSRFTTAYSSIGASPDGGMSYFLPKLVGKKIATELLVFADNFDCERAVSLGLINQVVPLEHFEQSLNDYIAKILARPSVSVANIKKLLQQSEQQDLAGQLESEAWAFVESASSEQFAEGVSAFLAKRRPNFT